MGRIGLESISNAKSQLVLEICSMSSTPIACSHKHHFNNPVKSHFIDWYRLLGVRFFLFQAFNLDQNIQPFFGLLHLAQDLPLQVAEDAGLELIKRRYHKLGRLFPNARK